MRFIMPFQSSALVTYLSMVSAIVGISHPQNLWLMLGCLLISAVCDISDGAFARRFKRSPRELRFGIAIDALADTLAFVALPITFLVSYVGMPPITLAIATLYACCGVTRLAVFQADATPGKTVAHYHGLPITTVGFIIPTLYMVSFILPPATRLVAMPLAYLLLAILFVIDFKVKKP